MKKVTRNICKNFNIGSMFKTCKINKEQKIEKKEKDANHLKTPYDNKEYQPTTNYIVKWNKIN